MPGKAQFYSKKLQKAADIIKDDVIPDISIRLIRNRSSSQQLLNLRHLLLVILTSHKPRRDIIVRRQSGHLQRIDELHMSYLPLQVPLLFPYGDNGYNSTNDHAHESLSTTKKKRKLTPKEYLTFHLMRRNSKWSLILHGNKLLQQFI